MKAVLTLAQLLISLLLATAILLQAKGTGLGNSALFGGGGEFYSSKRGAEKVIFLATIVLAVGFAVLSLILLLL